ncbi:MAG: ABC transporter permease subunit [Bryobacterales bacterium]|nr:ABC transporter permease [Bryobacteraceae bacterium]MDW8354643.1 ABC transporter permease subunit [Bryobacterales bacterium]
MNGNRAAGITAALVRDTFREAFARKIFLGFYGLSTLLILFFLFLLKIDVVEGARATVTLFGQTSGRLRDVEALVRGFQAGVATFLYTWGMALAVFASAGLIPTVLEAGRIDLLISKPVRRAHLLLGRYLGNLLVVALNVGYVVFGVWAILGWKTGVWRTEFLSAILTTTFIFAVLLSVIVLVSVLFESPAVSVMTVFGMMLLSPILAQTRLMERLLPSEWSRDLWKALYYVFPKVYDVGRMTLELVNGRAAGSLMPLWTSALFTLAILGAGLWLFARRDY